MVRACMLFVVVALRRIALATIWLRFSWALILNPWDMLVGRYVMPIAFSRRPVHPLERKRLLQSEQGPDVEVETFHRWKVSRRRNACLPFESGRWA